MTDITFPLYYLFTRLRQAELPLGIDDYALMLQAIQAGRGATREALFRLCQSLWVRSAEPRHLRLLTSLFEAAVPLAYGRQDDAPPSEEEVEEKTASGVDEQPDTDDGPKGEGTTTEEKTETYKEETEAASAEKEQEWEMINSFQGDEVGQALVSLQPGDVAEGDASPLPDIVTQAYYSFSRDYLPVTRRQMKQNWRYLRQAARFGPPVELDVDATVNRIAREGILTDPVLRPRRVNRAGLVLLFDYGGSMVPFHRLCQRLAETAVRGGKLGQASIYYFHDCPIEYLYHDPHAQSYELIPERLSHMHPVYTSVLIFSDGGAARGHFDEERVQITVDFLAQLQQVVRRVAWLNPMPSGRWPQTTAAAIASRVPMFDMTPLGLQSAIKTLRGRRPHAQEQTP